MSLTLYMTEPSPPCRAVLLTAEAIGIQLQHKIVDLLKGEHLSPEYRKLNPQHTIPTLIDNDVIITDSHAINCYLVRKYGKDDHLYPEYIAKRAMVDQRLHFETGTLFIVFRDLMKTILKERKKQISADQVKAVHRGYNFVEKFLVGRNYIAGDTVTIADFSIISTISSMNFFVNIDIEKYPNVTAWMRRMEELPYYNENIVGCKKFCKLMTKMMEN